MFLIAKFRIHCLERDYPVDNSFKFVSWSPMDKFNIRVLSGKYFILSVKYAGLYKTIKIFPVQCYVNQAANDTKIKFADNVWAPLW